MAEEERLVELRTAIQWQSEELEERKSVLEKREMALDKSHQSEGGGDRQQLSASGESGAKRKKETTGEDKVYIFRWILCNNCFVLLLCLRPLF